MPNTKFQVFRIKIIDELLSRHQFVKTSRIKAVIRDRLKEEVSDKTIQNDIKAMKDDTRLAYYAPIVIDTKNKAYKYSDPNFSINNFSLTEEEVEALRFYGECLQAFSGYKIFDSFSSGINKVINGIKSRNRLNPKTDPKTILQTDTLVAPGGHQYIQDLVYAIDNKYPVEIQYKPFTSKKAVKRALLPVYLKEYKNRWYLLAFKFVEQKIKTYSLDRITSLNIIEETSSQEVEFDPLSYFKHSFGITTPNLSVETVILKFSAEEANFIKSLPIHPTQQIISEDPESLTITIKVTVSYELFEFILGKTPNVKVIKPTSISEEIAKKLKAGYNLYASDR